MQRGKNWGITFLIYQLIGPFASMNTYPNVEFMSMLSPTQSNQDQILLYRRSHEFLFLEKSLGSFWILSSGSQEADPCILKPH